MSISRRTQLGSWLFCVIILLLACAPALWAAEDEVLLPAAAGNRITLDFDNLYDLEWVTDQFAHLGISFYGATVLGQGGSLNYLGFPPHSGLNVLYDDPVESGRITVTFDQAIATNVTLVGVYVTGNRNVTMTAYDAADNVLGVDETGGDNHAPAGIPNKLLQLSTLQPIKKVVFFNGGERGNTFTIDDFFFEGGQACNISGVPLYKQDGTALWAGDLYGGSITTPWIDPDTGQNAVIRNWGCAMTSTAMIVSYYAELQGKEGTDPRELNNWLRANGGYSGGNIFWRKVEDFAQDVKGIDLYFYEGRGPDNGIINAYLCNLAPIVLEVRTPPYANGHYVVATGVADSLNWTINDPAGHNLTTLAATPERNYRKYGTEQNEPQHLSVAIHPPNTPQVDRGGAQAAVSIIITDPAGRVLLYDAMTGAYENQILDASFGVERLASDGGDAVIETYVFGTGAPLEGEYQVQIIPHVAGVYELDLLAYDESDTASTASTSGYAPINSEIGLNIGYSPVPGSEVGVTPEWPGGSGLYLPAVLSN